MKKIMRFTAVLAAVLSISLGQSSTVLAHMPPPGCGYPPAPPRGGAPMYPGGQHYLPMTEYRPAPEPQPVQNGCYILPDSGSRYLSSSDVSWMDNATLRLALNEVYARHGRRFNDQYLQNYFNSQPWYHGTVSPSCFRESVFNRYEMANISLMAGIQKARGQR